MLNLQEMIIASILTAIVLPFPIAFLAIPVCALLWAYTGAGANKLYRRLGVPLIWSGCLLNWYAIIALPIGYAFLCVGYGIPSTQPYDSGSALGRIFFKLTKGNLVLSNILTRGIIYVGLVTPFLLVRYL